MEKYFIRFCIENPFKDDAKEQHDIQIKAVDDWNAREKFEIWCAQNSNEYKGCRYSRTPYLVKVTVLAVK